MKRTFVAKTVMCVIAVLMSCKIAAAQQHTVQLSDNFTQWTTSSNLLNSLAADFNCTFVPARLGFSSRGLHVTGTTDDFQLTGVQSLSTFTVPFTVVANVLANGRNCGSV
jgi:hypothetical protein